jgi:hypothetical protein
LRELEYKLTHILTILKFELDRATRDKVTALIDFINNASLSDAESWEYAVRVVLGNSLQPIHSIDSISPSDYLAKGERRHM